MEWIWLQYLTRKCVSANVAGARRDPTPFRLNCSKPYFFFYRNARIYLSRPFSLASTDFLPPTWHVFLFQQIDRDDVFIVLISIQPDRWCKFVLNRSMDVFFSTFRCASLNSLKIRPEILICLSCCCCYAYSALCTQTETRSVEEDCLSSSLSIRNGRTRKTEEDRRSERERKKNKTKRRIEKSSLSIRLITMTRTCCSSLSIPYKTKYQKQIKIKQKVTTPIFDFRPPPQKKNKKKHFTSSF